MDHDHIAVGDSRSDVRSERSSLRPFAIDGRVLDGSKPYPGLEVWLLAGSQEMYGAETLAQVESQWREVVGTLDASGVIPVRVVARGVVTSSGEIRRVCVEANAADDCVGLIVWMHTFSPARMWIAGLTALRKPLLHLHTQFNRELPWAEIDMDFMNLNQSAHGDREFAFIGTRMGVAPQDGRRPLAGPAHAVERIAELVARRLRLARGAAAHGRAVRRQHARRRGHRGRQGRGADPARVHRRAATASATSPTRSRPRPDDADRRSSSSTTRRSTSSCPSFAPAAPRRGSLVEAARIEAGLRDVPARRRADGVHRHLRGPPRPRAAARDRRAAADGGRLRVRRRRRLEDRRAGADRQGDGRAACPGGTSFMEDYTYDLAPTARLVLGAHMLEICPSIAAGTAVVRDPPALHRRPRGPRPARLQRRARAGGRRRDARPRRPLPAGRQRGRRRRARREPLPRLPVARAVWKPRPDFAHRQPRRGSTPAARTTRSSRRAREHRARSPTSPRSPASSWS